MIFFTLSGLEYGLFMI